jgi:dihydroorotase
VIELRFSDPPKAAPYYPPFVTLPAIFNSHGHPRDTQAEEDGRAEMMIPLYAEVFGDVMGMGNTITPLTTAGLARRKGAQWRALIPEGSRLKIHVAGLMHEGTSPAEVIAGYDAPAQEQAWIAMKMFMRSVSNSHGADVDDLSRVIPAIKAMAQAEFRHRKGPMPLSVHAERKHYPGGKRVFFLDRSKESMERDIRRIFAEVPKARVIICHVNSKYAVEMIRQLRREGRDIWGEIAPHYAQYTCDDLFEGPGGSTMINSHLFCLPIFGKEEDREAIREAMLSGEPWWFYGDDGACHWDNPALPKGVKISSDGFITGGQAQVPRATVSYVIEAFIEAGKAELLPDFLSRNGRRAFHLPEAALEIRFERRPWVVEREIALDSPSLGLRRARVAMGGQTRRYWPEGVPASFDTELVDDGQEEAQRK